MPESKKVTELISPSFYPKTIEEDISDTRPFLILASKDEILQTEQDIIARGTSIGDFKDFSLLSISPDQLFANSSKQVIEDFYGKELINNGDFLTARVDSGKFVHYNSFDDIKSDQAFRGAGAYHGKMKAYSELDKLEASLLEMDKTYTLSLWMYNQNENFGIDALKSVIIVQAEGEGKAVNWITTVEPFRSMVINENWSMAEVDFTIADTTGQIAILNKGQDLVEDEFYIDDLLIREKGVDLYKVVRKEGDAVIELFMNNHQIIESR